MKIISTHTPLAGRDGLYDPTIAENIHFYSHAPRGARLKLGPRRCAFTDFYSHAPRGARHGLRNNYHRSSKFLLTRPSRGATQYKLCGSAFVIISTHTPLAGRDPACPGE